MSATPATSDHAGPQVPAHPGGLARGVTQTLALLLDAYRQINASALFWISLVISGLVALIVGVPSIGTDGVSVFGFQLIPILTTDQLPRDDFYKLLFAGIGLSLPLVAWLTVWGNALAIVSTAGIFPNLVSGGSIDLYLSKPIGRVRLFVTKYLTGMLFVAAQATMFCGVGFLVIGVRGGAWEPAVLLGVPLVLLVFSYLWAVSVLVGIWTRSTLMAVLLTLVAWGLMAGVQVAEESVLAFSTAADVRAERALASVEYAQDQLADAEAAGSDGRQRTWQAQLEAAERVASGATETRDDLRLWHTVAWGAYVVLPKTAGTSDLLSRELIDLAGLDVDRDDDRPREEDSLLALVERDDFASGTSSRSTKLIHGGVRYLEKAI